MCRTGVRNRNSGSDVSRSWFETFRELNCWTSVPPIERKAPRRTPDGAGRCARVSITQRGNWRCPECTLAFCPFCQKSLLDRCEHVVASWTDDGGWNYSPFEHAPLPEVPEALEGLETTSQDWHDVFGEKAASVVRDAYTNYGELGWKPELEDEPSLFLWMLERQGLECDSSSWEVSQYFTSSFGNDYFSQERDRIFAAIKEEVAWLTAGLERLFTILRARHEQPKKPLRLRSLPADTRSTKKVGPCSRPTGSGHQPRSQRPERQRSREEGDEPLTPNGTATDYVADVVQWMEPVFVGDHPSLPSMRSHAHW
jgi:hypothetical protein